MIEIQNISYKYKNEKEALENINLKIEEGQVISVIGKNGSGKSTLARLIAGITKPSSRKDFDRWYRHTKQKRVYKT